MWRLGATLVQACGILLLAGTGALSGEDAVFPPLESPEGDTVFPPHESPQGDPVFPPHESPQGDTVVLTDSRNRYPLGLEIEILEDADKTWTIDDVISSAIARRFVKSSEEIPNFSYTASAWWVRFRVRNEADPAKRWLLVYDHSNLDRIELYRPDARGEGFRGLRTGILEPFTSRDVPHRRFVFNLPFLHGGDPGAPREGIVYLRFESATPVIIPLRLIRERSLLRSDQRSQLFLGIFYGLVFILIGYHLSFMILMRESVHLLFAAAILFQALIFAMLDGTFQLALWPRDVPSRTWFLAIDIALLAISYILFTRTFLQTKTRAPRLHRACGVVIYLFVLLAAISPFVRFQDLLVGPVLGLLIIGEVLAIASGVRIFSQGYLPARLFCYGSIIRLAGYIFFLSTRFDLIPATDFGDLALRIGLIGQGFFLSMALGDRINLIRDEKEKAQRHLAEQQQQALSMKEEMHRMLQTRNAELERFYHALSHEIKSPIITVRGFIEHLERDVRDMNTQRIRDDCARIRDSNDVLHRLVDKLAELSQQNDRRGPTE